MSCGRKMLSVSMVYSCGTTEKALCGLPGICRAFGPAGWATLTEEA
jgi:hypothetical protein